MAKEKERFETLLEEIRAKVSTVAEGHEIIKREMREMKGELKSEIGGLKSAIKFVSTKVDNVHDSLKKEIVFTAETVKDELRGEIRDVGKKLDEHLKVPPAWPAGRQACGIK